MLLSQDNKFLFVHIPKTAGTSIRNSLKPYAVDPMMFWENRLLSRIGIHVNVVSPWRRKRFRPHSTAGHIRQHLPSDVYESLFKFAFVRNPWDLLVSLYNFIPSRPGHRYSDAVKKMSFAEFVDAWTQRPEISQAQWLRGDTGELIVDCVGYFETVGSDFSAICGRLGINCGLPKHNQSKHSNYQTYYTNEVRDLVQTRLADDIEFLGYTFDGEIDSPCRSRSVSNVLVRRAA